MIFDDHDVTDDWNLSANWKRKVWNAPLGRQVVAIGLTAYWLVQGWGNVPSSFSPEFKEVIQAYVSSPFLSRSLQQKLGTMMWHETSWHFITPTYPSTLFIDTRTKRAYQEPAKKALSPSLVSEAEWSHLEHSLFSTGWKKQDPLLLVSPTPLYGIGLVESFLNKMVRLLYSLGLPIQAAVDYEMWKYNGCRFSLFLEKLVQWQPQSCLILSGDVHTSSVVRATIFWHTGWKIKIHQFTSSPLRNRSFSGIKGYLFKQFLRLNIWKRRRKVIQRICTRTFAIKKTTQLHQPYGGKKLSTDKTQIIIYFLPKIA